MISNAPKSVAVVIPLYNRERYIGQAVQSVLAQTYGYVHLYVVDDGSTDDSRGIVDDLAARHVQRMTVLEHPGRVNRGQSAALNLGIRAARDDYIAFLDSDDFWFPQKLERQVAFLDTHPNIGLVYGNGEAVDSEGNRLYDIYGANHREPNQASAVLLDCYFFVPTNSLLRRSVLDEVGPFDESLRAAQDHDMALRIAEITDLAYIPDLVFYYRRHADTISQRNALLRWRSGFKILAKAKARHSYPGSVLRRRRAVLHFRLYQCYWREQRYWLALPHLLAAGILDPARSIAVAMGREAVTSPN